MIVNDRDLELDIQHVPVRRGCNAWGGCACMGTCNNIIGFVNKDEYIKHEKAKGILKVLGTLKSIKTPSIIRDEEKFRIMLKKYKNNS